MINLLPVDEKKFLKREYRLRLLVVLFVFLTLLMGIGSLALLPSFFAATIKKSSLSASQAALEKNVSRAEQNNFITLLSDTNSKLTVLSGATTTTSLETTFSQIAANKPADVYLLEFTVDRETKGIRKVEVRGIAGTRESLATFLKNLQSEKNFTQVSFPVSDLTSNSNLDFSLTLNVSQ